jgi:UDP-N-acetylmuramoyl-tripeptide--D-alanyl-D-alanine ligase
LFTLLELLSIVKGHPYVQEGKTALHPQNVMIQGVSTDTRTLQEGDLFVPLRGAHFDGHNYSEKARERGAVATLWQKDLRPYPCDWPVILVDDPLQAYGQIAHAYRHRLGVKVVAITGSNGKTTTKDLISSMLRMKYRVHKTEGNFNNEIGLPKTLLSMPPDTEVAVLEMGMRGLGEISWLSRIAVPDLAVITNIGESHIERLGSREGIAKAKLEILDGMSASGLYIYDGDEPLLRPRPSRKIRSLSYGKEEDNDLILRTIEALPDGGTKINIDPDNKVFTIPLAGEHNGMNTLAAIAVGRELGLTDEEIYQGLEKAAISSMRMERSSGHEGITLLNDAYNASPTSMKAALRVLEGLTGFHKRIAILGDMLELGDEESAYHYEVGASIHPNLVDVVITVGERARSIADGAKSVQGRDPDSIHSFTTQEEAIPLLKDLADSHTVALFKASRGMKLEQMVEALKRS